MTLVALSIALLSYIAARQALLVAPPPHRLAGYRITYAVTVTVDRPERSTRVIVVRRPFESRNETFRVGERTPSSGVIASRDRAVGIQGGRLTDLGPRAPGPAPADYQMRAVLPELLRAGLARALGRASYAGRPCRLYRIGGPLGDAFTPPTVTEHADLCIDDDGLVVLEDWVSSGKPLRRTEATRVETSLSGTESFTVATASPAPEGATQVVQPLSRGTVPDIGAPYWVVREPPWGFRLTNRSRAFGLDPSGAQIFGEQSLIDTYVKATYAVTVEHTRREFDASGSVRKVGAGPVGTGVLFLTPYGPDLKFRHGQWVISLRGTLDVPMLMEFARRLRPLRAGP